MDTGVLHRQRQVGMNRLPVVMEELISVLRLLVEKEHGPKIGLLVGIALAELKLIERVFMSMMIRTRLHSIRIHCVTDTVSYTRQQEYNISLARRHGRAVRV